MPEALTIAVLGAESTGKTALSQALAARLRLETGLSVAWVPEVLRAWCDGRGRTPRAHEQAAIALEQQHRMQQAAWAHEVVVSDTSALMTAVYSRYFFDDHNLDALALSTPPPVQLHLLMALDLPWVADGHQRSGPQVQKPIDALLRGLLIEHRLPWALVSGQGAARLECALDAVAPLLRQRATPRAGLFTRLLQREADAPPWPWLCERCDLPECEHLSGAVGNQPAAP